MSGSPVRFSRMLAHRLGVAGRRVDAGADGRRPHVDLADERLCLAQAVHILQHRVREGVEFLAERHRHGVLKLCAPHLDVAGELLALVEERRRERDHRQLQIPDCRVKRELHRRRIHVVRRLTEIDVVVRVHDVVLAALLPENLQRAVGDDLVGVHVRRSAGAALNHVDAEMPVVQSLSDLTRSEADRAHYLVIKEIHVVIRPRCRFLHRRERRDQAGEFAKLDAGDREVFYRAQRLNSVKRCRRNIALAEQIVLATSRPREIHTGSAGGLETQRPESGWVGGLHA